MTPAQHAQRHLAEDLVAWAEAQMVQPPLPRDCPGPDRAYREAYVETARRLAEWGRQRAKEASQEQTRARPAVMEG